MNKDFSAFDLLNDEAAMASEQVSSGLTSMRKMHPAPLAYHLMALNPPIICVYFRNQPIVPSLL